LYEDHNTEDYVHVAAQLLLFGPLSYNKDEFKPPKVLLTCSVSTSLHMICFYFSTRVTLLRKGGIDVVEAATIEETAFSLPCVQEPGDDFPMKHNMAKCFVVFPPRSEWTDIW
jgi:hypothetical protein